MELYVLRNDELGGVCHCPTFENKNDAEREAAFKCRQHNIIVIDENQMYEPCKPKKLTPDCMVCARCASTVEKRKTYVQSLEFDTIDAYLKARRND